MSDFWNNIIRYPRFFISSLIGSTLVILAPLKNIFKISKFRGVLILSIFTLIVMLVTIIKSMIAL
jgi:hypothetical protein